MPLKDRPSFHVFPVDATKKDRWIHRANDTDTVTVVSLTVVIIHDTYMYTLIGLLQDTSVAACGGL